ncbi:MAG: thiamine diphosphokinase [Ruminococcaceae bacterium]|nr:thiamine diphosphokinase [Oscillospiraceae bacterium]
MNRCYIIGANCGEISFLKNEGDLIIAADGGYKAALKSGIKPDVILGDFDSLGYIPVGSEVITLPVCKDDTDTLYAVKLGLSRGFKSFFIYGGLGGRTDHTIANIQTLGLIAEKGGRGYLVSDDEVLTVVKNGSISFNAKAYGTVSVFSFGGKAQNVNINGLFYEIHDATFDSTFPLGVSNSFKGIESVIEVQEGCLLIVFGKTEYVSDL